MEQWVSIFTSKGYQVCAEKGVTQGLPSIIFRFRKDGGELRSQMAIPMPYINAEGMRLAVISRDQMFSTLDQDMVDAAVDSMLELEPDLMDGKQHAFVIGDEDIHSA